MIAAALVTFLSLAIWLVLLLGRGFFWRARERDDRDTPVEPVRWPSVVAVVPARNEADVIARSIGSLLAQDYAGAFRVILVDDQSGDGTGHAARALGSDRLTVLDGAAHTAGWTGKLFAVSQGVAAAGAAPDYLWLTDADIAHAPDNLRRLMARAEKDKLVLVSLMAKLNCESFAEHFLIPAFVFFFDMLFPFGWVNDPRRRMAAAAGGCMLVRREALERAGGIEAIRTEIIDDCALGRALKAQGAIWLGLTERAVSLRPYPKIGDIRHMVSRSAYAQLHYSPVLLAGTVLGMLLLYVVPLVGFVMGGLAALFGALAWAVMTVMFQPMLYFYRRSPFWGLALPLIGVFYAGFTIDSAVQVWRGHGGMWKGRAQAIAPT
ncbi:MAG: glycosyltransferase [Alphaproteobacteria bacterium]|nr:glycosyltransferase [Alphaproteobacteria bacterium]MDE2499179.1 glycosyltransferase [Alphaproteobacteria bacterium]